MPFIFGYSKKLNTLWSKVALQYFSNTGEFKADPDL